MYIAQATDGNIVYLERPRRDTQKDSALLRLPLELSVEVLLHCLANKINGRPTNPLLFGKICSAWREIAWSTPQLWSSLSMVLSARKVSQLDLLSEWLERSGRRPLTIRLQCEYMDHHWDAHPPHAAMKLIAECSERWLKIDLFVPVACIQALDSTLRGHVPLLTSLTLQSTNTEVTPMDSIKSFEVAPQLHTLCVAHGFSPYAMLLPWNQLTRFYGHMLSFGDCLIVLHQAFSLAHCTFDAFDSPTGDEADLVNVVVLPNLTTLVLTCDSGDTLGELFDSITISAACTLEVNFMCHCDFPQDEFILLLRRSLCKLEQLSFTDVEFSTERLVKVLEVVPSLLEFRLDYTSPPLTSMLFSTREFMELLHPMRPGFLLPNLQVFDYTAHDAFDDRLFQRVMAMRRGHHNYFAVNEDDRTTLGPLQVVMVRIPSHSWFLPRSHIKAQLLYMMKKGLDISITQTEDPSRSWL